MTQALTTARNALQILKAFTPEQPEWGVRELSCHLGWSRSTTHALLSTLASEGFLMQSSERRYRLGWTIFELGSVCRESEFTQVSTIIYPHGSTLSSLLYRRRKGADCLCT